jgi:hypothetical protein
MSVALDQGHLPGTRQIINHDIMNCTADGVTGNRLYSGRALGTSEPWDLIQLHPDLQPLWDDICAHYERIGLRHSRHVIWHVHRAELGEHIGFHPSVFYFGPEECRFWGDNQWMETVEFINSKNNFMALAAELGVDVPQTRCFDSVCEIDADVIAALAFPCYLKAAVSVSGVGIYRCRQAAELLEAMGSFGPETPLQIQEEVRTERFLNLQYQVVGGDLHRLTASEQILDGFVHQGNRVPASHEPWDAVEPMAQWLLEHGMKGIFAFDVAVVQTPDGGLRFPAIECNPRFNGASYPTLIANKLGVRTWRALAFATTHRSLAAIDLDGIEFDPASGRGVVLVNWGPVLEGKILVLLAGPPRHQDALERELARRL